MGFPHFPHGRFHSLITHADKADTLEFMALPVVEGKELETWKGVVVLT